MDINSRNFIVKISFFCIALLFGVLLVCLNTFVFKHIDQLLSNILFFLKTGQFNFLNILPDVTLFFLLSILPSFIVFVPFFVFESFIKKKDFRLVIKSLYFKFFGMAVIVLISLVLSRIDPRRYLDGSFIIIDAEYVDSFLGHGGDFIVAFFALIFYDFAIYTAHFLQHKISFLWKFHSVHHSITRIDSLNSYAHPIDFVGQWIFMMLVVVVFDFRYSDIILLASFKEIHERLLHTNLEINFGFLKSILIDNRHHFLHHSVCKEDYDVNFAAYFTFWDRILGTYKRPEQNLCETGVYGLVEPENLKEYLLANLKVRKSIV